MLSPFPSNLSTKKPVNKLPNANTKKKRYSRDNYEIDIRDIVFSDGPCS